MQYSFSILLLIFAPFLNNSHADRKIHQNSRQKRDYEDFVVGDASNMDKLTKYLFNNQTRPYNPEIIPVTNHQPITIFIQLYLIEIVQFDTLNQELQALLKIFLDWEDYRLNWDDELERFGNISRIDAAYSKVWFPNVGVTNSADGSARFTTEDNTNKIEVNSEGLRGGLLKEKSNESLLWRHRISCK